MGSFVCCCFRYISELYSIERNWPDEKSLLLVCVKLSPRYTSVQLREFPEVGT